MGLQVFFRIKNLWVDQFQNGGVLSNIRQIFFLGISNLISHKAKIMGLWGIMGIHLRAIVVVVLQNKERAWIGSIQG